MHAFLPDQTTISQVRLRTANLDRAADFYSLALGLQLKERHGRVWSLSAAKDSMPIIVLEESPEASVPPADAIGLYHVAIRYPSRRDLAFALKRLWQWHYAIEGAADHLVSEAIYLSDPDGSGIEIYADRPNSQWTWRDGQVEMRTEPLDMEALLATVQGARVPASAPPETVVGHVHLKVADLEVTRQFYNEFLGLAVTQRSYPGALFFSAGGYHHHVGVNTWASRRSPSPGSTGLISFRLQVPVAEILYCLGHRAPLSGFEARSDVAENSSELLRIRDPNGTWLEVESAGESASAEPRGRPESPANENLPAANPLQSPAHVS